MKKLVLFALLGVSLTMHAQKKQWKPLHEFNSIVSQIYYPAQQNNFKPLKDSSDALVAKAKDWQASEIPTQYDTRSLKQLLKKLVKDSEAIQSGVKKNKQDEELRPLVAKMNETFQQIMTKCNDQLW